ncbi:cytochrome b/b6 domain-containing protein [Thalassotalea sp. 1_MG-2023]|uniref:cytochrome b/b6 domain-containing protein n=1 Tax=Thalassotalea sp. 1_MG-2023 TaxID=3062680 RepID=UPI0026E1803F|nr:cytochrome b/b6 domain-containing protein [Thalassotalea sp. 1_MG-2023]MDO6428526.1 cytochrome b/b6 domain-containing protein [Thalassotalea sp. 1_MG-2023]
MKQYLIWDLPIRLFHWLLVGTLLALWYTSENGLIENHIKCGYFALSLIVFRIVWGIVGTRHARFIAFFPTPSRLKKFLLEKREPPGHNPLGALMIILMLVLIGLQATSGLFIDDDVFSSGPYYGVLSSELEKIMNTIHHNGFDFILIASALHIVAIAYYRVVKKKDLIKPMLTGKKSQKDVNENDGIPHSKIITFIVTAAAVGFFIYWLVVLNAPVMEEFYY